MKDPKTWSKKEIYEHLQHALDLELWTVPLYLTAAYSIKGLKGTAQKDYPDAAKLILSVVVQEMLHIELVCNLSNALGYSPKFNRPQYDAAKGIPFIHPEHNHLPSEIKGYTVQCGPLNENSLKLFCAIEFPHLSASTNWTEKKEYRSIAEFYLALREAILHHWDDLFVGKERNTKQKLNFSEYGGTHGFSQVVTDKKGAEMAIEAIIEQGEGAHADHVPADFQPHIPKDAPEHASWFKGDWSHYEKFFYLLHNQDNIPELYPGKESPENKKNERLQKRFDLILQQMEKDFNEEGEEMDSRFWAMMTELGVELIWLWEAGIVPHF